MVTDREIEQRRAALNRLVNHLREARTEQRQGYASAIARQKGWFMEHGLRLKPVFAEQGIIGYVLQEEDRCSM